MKNIYSTSCSSKHMALLHKDKWGLFLLKYKPVITVNINSSHIQKLFKSAKKVLHTEKSKHTATPLTKNKKSAFVCAQKHECVLLCFIIWARLFGQSNKQKKRWIMNLIRHEELLLQSCHFHQICCQQTAEILATQAVYLEHWRPHWADLQRGPDWIHLPSCESSFDILLEAGEFASL